MKRALIQRYDNEPDIRAVAERGFSNTYRRSACDDFELVIVVPTRRACTDLVAVGRATSTQYTRVVGDSWPGRLERYPVRVDVADVRYTTVDRVRRAFEEAGVVWQAAWTVCVISVDDRRLLHD